MKIYHNPRCRKSRETLELIRAKNSEPEIIEYLSTPPSKSELDEILKMLGLEPLDLIRKGEKVFKEKFKGKDNNRQEWIEIMVENPILIERPIVISNGKAVIGRPPENVNALL